MVHSMEPVIEKNAKILILGSMPGSLSLQKQQYYAHPQNRFWPILFTLFGEAFTEDYKKRIALVKNNGIALWDTIASCEREGSLDKNIHNETPNDITGLIREHPSIRQIFCNGQKSFAVYHRHFSKTISVPAAALPSTSPIPRKTIRSLNDLLPHWRLILQYI